MVENGLDGVHNRQREAHTWDFVTSLTAIASMILTQRILFPGLLLPVSTLGTEVHQPTLVSCRLEPTGSKSTTGLRKLKKFDESVE